MGESRSAAAGCTGCPARDYICQSDNAENTGVSGEVVPRAATVGLETAGETWSRVEAAAD